MRTFKKVAEWQGGTEHIFLLPAGAYWLRQRSDGVYEVLEEQGRELPKAVASERPPTATDGEEWEIAP